MYQIQNSDYGYPEVIIVMFFFRICLEAMHLYQISYMIYFTSESFWDIFEAIRSDLIILLELIPSWVQLNHVK